MTICPALLCDAVINDFVIVPNRDDDYKNKLGTGDDDKHRSEMICDDSL
jgi:hypothetical protein